MTDSHEIEAPEAPRDWPIRPLLLAVLGLVTGFAVHLIIGASQEYQLSATKLAMLAFVVGSVGVVGFTIERRLWWTSLGFGLATGAIAAAVVWWNGGPDGWSGGDGWRAISLLLAVAIAAPLYQAARDAAALRFPYRSVHDHAWTNVVLWAACCVFVGIVIALAYLLAGLFDLIKLSFLSDLLREDWFWRIVVGLAFGGALGVLREQTQVVRLLQRVALTVLSILAPVLAVGLIVFVLALPFTGLAPLWQAGSATGILLACIVGSLILANSVIGNAPQEERRFPALRYGAMGLGLVMLPLGVIAGIAIGLRIGQYGFTPERLWALTFVILACAYGLAYLVSLLLGRWEWAARVRPANLNLAFATCAVALLLATPLVSFNAISTRDQVARLESGRTGPEKFDWRALAFDFGDPGKAALKKLQASANAAIRERAVTAGKAEDRWSVPRNVPSHADVARQVRVLPVGAAMPAGLLDYLAQQNCGDGQSGGCAVLVVDPATVMVLQNRCFDPTSSYLCGNVDQVKLAGGKWSEVAAAPVISDPVEAKARAEAQHRAFIAGQIEVREVRRRQVFVGGQPLGIPFE